MKLVIFKEIPARLPVGRLHRLFDTVVDAEGNAAWPTSVNLVITDDRRIRRLNKSFRSVDRATDVLSFNIDPPEEPEGVFGEVYLSVPYIRCQADRYRKGVWAEYLLLFCHGLLHLFGYDHTSESDEAVMSERQKQYLTALLKKR